MILTQDAKSIFNGQNLRGHALAAGQFETRHINLVPVGGQTRAFIVAPVSSYHGHHSGSTQPSGNGYNVYGVYAVDETTLATWKKSQRQDIQKAFNTSGNKTPFSRGFESLPTLSAANKMAKSLNETAYENHIKDFQEGKLSGVTAWIKRDRCLIPKPIPQESLMAG